MENPSDPSIDQGTPRFGPDERQEIMEMLMEVLDQRERHRQTSQGLHETPNPNGRTQSTTTTESTTQATLKASEIGFFYPNMPLT
jgi:hypothetical protein